MFVIIHRSSDICSSLEASEGVLSDVITATCIVRVRGVKYCTPPTTTVLHIHIRESVDSLCRDDVDMPMPPYIYIKLPNAAFVSLLR